MEQQCLPWQIWPLQHHVAPTQPPMSTAMPSAHLSQREREREREREIFMFFFSTNDLIGTMGKRGFETYTKL